MNTPITANYFRKLELYQEVLALNRIFRKAALDYNSKKSKNTWEIDKKVLYWSRLGHKHLGSAVQPDDFTIEGHERLKSTGLTVEEVKDKFGGGQYWPMNLVRRGFAELEVDKNGVKGRGILITEKGLLMGSVLSDMYRLKCIADQRIWHKKFWSTYAEKYGATHFLAKRYKYWAYLLFIVIGWALFFGAAVLVFWAIAEKVF